MFLSKELFKDSLVLSFQKLNPKILIKNPVIFITYIGSILSLMVTLGELNSFNVQITCWLFFTVLFSNFSEALAEGKGRAQAQSLKKTQQNLMAKKIDLKSRKHELIAADLLNKNDTVLCEAGDIIPMDGEVIEGVASVDESAITGESAPVIRESGGDRTGVTGGTTIKSDWLVIRITATKGESVVDKMIHLIEGAKRQKTPNELALSLVLSGLSFILICVVLTLKIFTDHLAHESQTSVDLGIPVLISLLVCLIPTTIGGLLSAIGISGMNRLIRCNIIAKSGRAVEAAGDISVLLLDKTGTITYGNRRAHELIPADGVSLRELATGALLSSMADETAEGRSIVELCHKVSNGYNLPPSNHLFFIPFTAETRMSGVDISSGDGPTLSVRKGAVDSIIKFAESKKIDCPPSIKQQASRISEKGGTPLLVCHHHKILGLIYLKDVVKEGMKEKFQDLRKMGIKTIMITGDNPLTAASIAAEAGVDDFIAEATPEDKLRKIREEQQKGFLVAMTGDGTNDAPALAQADVGVAMNSGTQAAKEAGNMVDLDSDPTKLIEVVEVGKQLLMTRGALTTFSFANDLAKYFAILPAVFATLYATNQSGPLAIFNVMNLASPRSAILSSVIFNAIIIIILTPLAIKGVKFEKMSTDKVLLKNILIYGVGGILTPFFGIKMIDLIIFNLSLV